MDIPDPKVGAFKGLSLSTVALTILIKETSSLNKNAKLRCSECRNKQFCRPTGNSPHEIIFQGYYIYLEMNLTKPTMVSSATTWCQHTRKEYGYLRKPWKLQHKHTDIY
jgi:hypothetical protein